jgi:hypothetical protein
METNLAPMHGSCWIDRCLGDARRVSWEPDQLTAAVAGATMALDGHVARPTIEATSYAPARQAEVDWTIALAALATNQGAAAATVDRAFATADQIGDAAARDRILLWGAIELRARGDMARAAQWAAALRNDDHRRELVADDVRRRAESGDLDGAQEAIATLPPIWSLRVDVESWHGYPRWVGSAAAAACAALASPRVASSPAARAVAEAAERLSTQITEEWRQNREHRALALAWARLGDLERAMFAASRMPGSERSSTLVELLDLFGDAPGVELARLEVDARRAIAATRSAPLVLSDAKTDPDALHAFVGDVVVGEIGAAIARRHLAREDLVLAGAAIQAIPTHLSAHHEAALQLACARLKRGETTVERVVASLSPDDPMIGNLIGAASRVGCLEVVHALLRGARHADRLAANETWRSILQARFDDATALLCSAWDRLTPIDRGELQAGLVSALSRAGRLSDALAVSSSMPAHDAELPEKMALAADHRLIVSLAATGELPKAQALRVALAPRLARSRP